MSRDGQRVNERNIRSERLFFFCPAIVLTRTRRRRQTVRPAAGGLSIPAFRTNASAVRCIPVPSGAQTMPNGTRRAPGGRRSVGAGRGQRAVLGLEAALDRGES